MPVGANAPTSADSLAPGKIWQEKEVDPSDHQRGEHDASGQEDPKLEMIVEVRPVMNALDQIGAAEGHLQDLDRLGVDLDLMAVLAPHWVGDWMSGDPFFNCRTIPETMRIFSGGRSNPARADFIASRIPKLPHPGHQ